jgi:hypothetical protein
MKHQAMHTMKLAHLWVSRPVWAQINQVKKPPTVGYHVGRFFHQHFMKEAAELERLNNQWVTELGVDNPDKPGTLIVLFNGPNWPEYEKRLNELLAQDIELPAIMIPYMDFVACLPTEGEQQFSDSDIFLVEPYFATEEELAAAKAAMAGTAPAGDLKQ